MKKRAAVVLVLIIMFAMAPPAMGRALDAAIDYPQGNANFVDTYMGIVLETDEHIRYIYGYPEGDVRPDAPITRAELTAIFYRLTAASDKNMDLSDSFSDVPEGAWYAQGVKYMKKYGIVFGYADGSFRPNAPITRAEFAAISARFDNLRSGALKFFDVPAGHWAASFIAGAAAKGWINGFPDGSFRPEESATRAQTVRLVNAMLNRKTEPADIPGWAGSYSDLSPGHWGYADIKEASSEHDYTRKPSGYELWR